MLPDQPHAIRRLVREKVETDARNISVVYSGPQGIGRVLATDIADDAPNKNNHNRAMHFANTIGANIIDRTTAGKVLANADTDIYELLTRARKSEIDSRYPDKTTVGYRNALNRAIERGISQANSIFSLTSREMCTSIVGPVRTFVCGAGADRVFRQDELESLMQNRAITIINGVPRTRFEGIYQAERKAARHNTTHTEPTLNRTFRAICLAELRQDRMQAFRTGDPNLIQDVVLRHEIYRSQQATEKGRTTAEPVEAVRARIAKRTAAIAAFAQNRNRSEARAGIEAIMATRVAQGTLTPAHATQLSLKLAAKLADPHRAYRINQSLKMQQAMERIRKADPYAMRDYTQRYTELLHDTQIIAHRVTPTHSVPATERTMQHQGGAFSDHVRKQQQRAYAHLGQEIAISRSKQDKTDAPAVAKPKLLLTT